MDGNSSEIIMILDNTGNPRNLIYEYGRFIVDKIISHT